MMQAIKCLLLEDSATQAKIMSSILGQAGCECMIALSVREYKGKPELFDATFDLVLIDINYGGISGLELIDDVRKRWPEAVVGVMTADSTDNYSGLVQARERGVKLVLRKPFGLEEARSIADDVASIRAGGAAKLHAVVIDDSRTCGKVAAGVLRPNGYRVTVFDNAQDAIERLSYDQVNVVITDLFMPGTDGHEVIKLVRDVWPHVALVAMTGGTDGSDIAGRELKTARSHGANALLYKPYGAEEMLSAVRHALEEQRELNGEKPEPVVTPKGSQNNGRNRVYLDV
ncbi:response regulator [Hirschia litorea]|uniref:Response regulator n=1 Tax=Hirschia litorea TaxID=1199156 RepID=A0ABW2ILD5_9PROT